MNLGGDLQHKKWTKDWLKNVQKNRNKRKEEQYRIKMKKTQ
jgi:hypothetical protein